MRILATAALLAAPLAAAVSQHRLDPVSMSLGGNWLRRGGDSWHALSAPALLATLRGAAAGVAHHPGWWGIRELSASAVSAALPAGPAVFGVSLTRFGSGLYSETGFGASFGSRAGPVLWGAGARYVLLRIDRYGTAGIPSADAGAVLEMGERFRWGLRFTDLNRPAVGGSGERRSGTSALSAAFSPVPGLELLIQGERNELGEFSTAAGIAATWDDAGIFAGASEEYSRIHCGGLLSVGGIGAGYGALWHPELGLCHALWIFWKEAR